VYFYGTYTIYQSGCELHVGDPCCTISVLPACFLWPQTSLWNVNGSFSSSETLHILQHGEWLQMYWMRCCRQKKVGELLWGLEWGIENRAGLCMTSLQYPFTACMEPNFSEELYKNSPHCQGSNSWITNISTKNIFVSPHTLRKLLCKRPHLFKVYLLIFFLIHPFVL